MAPTTESRSDKCKKQQRWQIYFHAGQTFFIRKWNLFLKVLCTLCTFVYLHAAKSCSCWNSAGDNFSHFISFEVIIPPEVTEAMALSLQVILRPTHFLSYEKIIVLQCVNSIPNKNTTNISAFSFLFIHIWCINLYSN